MNPSSLELAVLLLMLFLHLCFILTQAAQLQNHIDATLGSGNLREAVRLPPGEHPNEWLAVNSKKINLNL